LYLFDEEARHTAATNMHLASREHFRARTKHSEDKVTEVTSKMNDQLHAHQRLEWEKEVICTENRGLQERVERSERENKELKQSISQLLPRKMQGVLKGIFSNN
jgi:hypothetical protein